MADAEQSIPDIYRDAAEEIRQLARRARLTDIRDDLLELSARFERLAAYADAAIRLGAPGYPHGERLPVVDDNSDRAPAADRPLSSGSGPHTAFTGQDRCPPEPVTEPVENAPKGTEHPSVSGNPYSHRAASRAKSPPPPENTPLQSPGREP